ncbi:hypothetical protein PENSPDRAFT_736084 [Peniophora sp. CONT]|nr:hypothetical protein PENSPDRAFT_736084 [Peniophora sp. CONT]
MTCPILPPELLGIIFELVAIEHPFLVPFTVPCDVPTHPPTDRGPFELAGPQCDECRTTFPLGWFSVTHVCRRWRDAAYATSSLWTRINNYMPRPAVEVCLECSRGQPLSLFIGRHRHVLTHPNQDWTWPGAVLEEEELARIAFLFSQAHLRIQKLVTTRDLLRRLIPIFAQSPLHNVQSINLLFCDKLNENSADLIASLRPHCLRELSLVGLTFIQWSQPGTLWPDIVASSLHSLVCDGIGYTPLVIRGLRGLRSLRFLRVHKMSGNMQDMEAATSGTAIELLHCQEIDLDGLDEQVAGFLNALHLRPDVRLRIRSRLLHHSIHMLPPNVAAIRAHLFRPGCQPITPFRTVTFHHVSSYAWRLCASRQVESASRSDLDVTYDTSLVRKSPYEDFFGLSPTIADNIIGLHITSPDPGATNNLPRLLRHNFSSFTSLELLRVCGTGMVAQAVDDLLPQPDDPPLFPVLRELVLADLPSQMLSAEYEELGVKLLVIFNTRRKAGVPIRVLQVPDGEMMHGKTVWDELSSLVTVRIAQDT